MTISFSGLASGLDTSSWVESLVALKQAKVETLETEKEDVLSLQETLSSIKSFFSSFRSMLEKVTDAKFGVASMDLFAQNLATSSNLDVLTASATTEAEEGTYDVLVDQLASETQAVSNYSYMTTIIQTTTATGDSKLINLGVKAGNIGVNVNGVERGITITENDTISTFIEKLKNIGVEASFNEETGIFSINVDDDDINDIDGTGIVDALHLEGVNEGYTSNSLQTSKTDTVFSAATESTLLSELGVNAGVITVEANDTSYNITIYDTSTLGTFITDLRACNIDATLDSNGIFTISDAEITSEGATNILDALGLTADVSEKSQITGDLTHMTIVTQTTTATSSTLLRDINGGTAIANGQTVIVRNSNNEYTTITVGTTTTIGELLQDMSNAGLYAAINNDGTVEITGGTITGGTFDAVEALGLEKEPYSAMVTGDALTETVEVRNPVTLETRLVDDLKVTEGYLEVTDADGNKEYLKIYSGQTIADLMTALANYGLSTDLDEETGVLSITGGAFKTLTDADVQALVNDGTIRETDSRYIHGTNLLECLYGAGTISTDHITVASTYSKTQALSHSVINTINASLTTTLGDLGLNAGTAVFDVRGENRTINVTAGMTIEELMEALANQGIASSWDNEHSKITIENSTLAGGTSNLADVLNLTETISGKYTTSDQLYARETLTIDATRDTVLADYGITNSMSTADRTVNLYDSDGNLVASTVVGEGTTIGNLLDFINNQTDISASLQNGILTIHNGYIENSALETAMGLETSNKSSYVLGSQMTVTTTAAVTGETTLGSIISTLGTTDKVAGGYNLNFNGTDLAVSADTTINELINMIYDNGGTASLDNTGRLSVNGGTLTGSVAEALGIKSVTHTSSVSASGETLFTEEEVYADRDTTLAELGINDSSYVINDNLGNALTTINVSGTTTLGTFLDTLKANGIDGVIANGVISLESLEGKYITGALANALGITVNTTTDVVNTSQSSTAPVTHTGTVTADITTTLGEIGAVTAGGGEELLIYNSDQVCIATISSLTTSSTIGDLFDVLGAYGIQGSIINGVISLYSESGSYAAGEIMDNLGITVESGINTTFTIGQTITSSDRITYTDNTVATEDSLMLGLMPAPLPSLVVDVRHYEPDGSISSIGSITITNSTTIGDFFDQLKQYQINGSIDDGVITLTSEEGNGVFHTYLQIYLGFDIHEVNVTITTGATSTSTTAITFTEVQEMTADTKLSDLGINTSPFINPVDRLTEEEARAQGYTIIKTADELQAMQNNLSGKYILMNDIDLSGYDWEAIGDMANRFAGEFNGNGYVIKNLTINTTDNNIGLFGYTYGANIRNIGLENADVTGGENTGGLVGMAMSSTISNCYTTGSVSGQNNSGGLVGHTMYSSQIDNCYSTSSVNGQNNVGGLAGYLQSGTITNIYAAGSVSGQIYVGGLAGRNNTGTISSSYTTSSVSGQSYVGGLVGYNNSRVSSSYATGSVSGQSYTGGFFGDTGSMFVGNNLYYNTETTGQTTAIGNGSSRRITGVSTSELNELIADGTLSQYDGLRVLNSAGETLAQIELGADATVGDMLTALAAYGITGKVDNGIITLSSTNGNYITGTVADALGIGTVETTVTKTVGTTVTSTAPVTYTTSSIAELTTPISELVSTYKIDGTITAEGVTGTVIGISTAQELEWLADIVNGANGATNSMSGKTIILLNDIDMSGITDWTPIGDRNDVTGAFSGTFDGQGYRIENLTISGPNPSNSNVTEFVGLFGMLEGATIKNLILSNFDFTYTPNTLNGGFLAGLWVGNFGEETTISNVRVSSSSASGSIGGLIGNTYLHSIHSSLVIENCATSFTVTTPDPSGVYTVGGIFNHLGSVENVTISGCNSSFIADGSFYYGGGIVGRLYAGKGGVSSVDITDCSFYGTINSTRPGGHTGIGGIIGTFNPGENGVSATISINRTYSNATLTAVNSPSYRISGVIGAVTYDWSTTDPWQNTSNYSIYLNNTYYSGTYTNGAYYNPDGWNTAIYQNNVQGSVSSSQFCQLAMRQGFSVGKWDLNAGSVAVTYTNPYNMVIVDSEHNGLRVWDFSTYCDSKGISTEDAQLSDLVNFLDAYGDVSYKDGVLTFDGNGQYCVIGPLAETLGLNVVQSVDTYSNGLYSTALISSTISSSSTLASLYYLSTGNLLPAVQLEISVSTDYSHDITLRGSDTLDDLFTQLAAYDVQGYVRNGRVYIQPTKANVEVYTNDVYLIDALKLGGGLLTYSLTVGNTESSLIYEYEETQISNSTLMGSINAFMMNNTFITLVSNGVTHTINIDNTTMTVGDFFNQLSQYGIYGHLSYGTVTISGTEDAYVQNNIANHLVLDTIFKFANWSDVLTGQSTLSFTTTSVETTYTNDESDYFASTITGELTTSTLFSELNVGADGYVTVNSDGTQYIVTVTPDMSVDDLISTLAGFGISGSVHDGKISFVGTENAYIKGMSTNIMNALALRVGENYTYESEKQVTTTTTSNELEETKTYKMTTSTTLGELAKSAGGGYHFAYPITVVSNGVEHTVTVTHDTTIDDMISTLAGYGISGSVRDGKLTFSADVGSYIKDLPQRLQDLLKLTSGEGNSWTTVEGATWVNSDSNDLSVEKDDMILTGDTVLSTIDGFKGGNLIVHQADGRFVTINVDATGTLDDFFKQIADYGLVGSVDSEGRVTVTGVGNVYLQAASGGSNILTSLNMSNVIYNVQTIRSNSTSDTLSHTIQVAASGSTTLDDLALSSGDEITFDGSGNVSLVLETTSDAGNQRVTLTFSRTSSLYDVIDKLAEYGINASVDAMGRFSITSSTLTDFDISGELGDFLMGAYHKEYGEDTTYNVSTNLVQETIVNMKDSDLLSQFGVTGGNILITQQGVNYTVNVDMTNIVTVGDFRNLLAQYGFTTSIDDHGRLSVSGVGESYLSSIAGGSNILDVFGLTDWTLGEITQQSDHLTDTEVIVHAITMQDKISELTDAAGNNLGITAGQIYVYQDGTRSTLNIDTNDTLETLAAKLSQYGITLGISQEGRIYFDGNNNSYLTTDGLSSANASNILEKIGAAGDWETRYDSTSAILDYTEKVNNVVTGSTKLSDLQDAAGNNLGITEGTYYVYSNGVRNTETITADMTVNDLMATLAYYGLVADIDENGSISVGAYNNTYLATSALAGQNSNIVSTLFAEWDFVNIYTSNGLDVPQDVIEAIDRDTKLSDINEGTYQDGYITVVKDGIQTNISLTADDTVGTLMDELALYGFESVINENGQLIIKNTGNSLLQNYTGPEKASNVLDLLGIGLNDWISTDSYKSSTINVVQTSTLDVSATRDTLMSELGVSTGEYYVYNNGVRYTALISSDETLGSFMDTLASFGLETSLVDGPNGAVLSIVGKGDSYIAKSTSTTNASNVVDVLFNNAQPSEKYEYKGLEQTSEIVTTYSAATEETLLSYFDNGLLLAEGDLSVTVNGQTSIIKIGADETFGSLLQKFRDLGLEATLNNGQIMIQSGFDTFTINTNGTTSNLMATVGLVYHDDLGGYGASSDTVKATTTNIEEKTLSVSNYADLSTQMGLLNISDGSLTVYRDGEKATIQINSNETFGDLRTRLSTAFSDLELAFEDGYLSIYSKDGRSVEVGSTTDTSNFSAITGIAKQEDGASRSARELYCVNSDSVVTASGLFRRGNVTEGTFYVGDAMFTVTSTTTLANLISQINSSDEANATAYWDNIDGKFVIKSRTTGSALVNIEAGTSNFTDIMGYTTSEWNADGSLDVTRMNVDTQEIGDNAKVTINGTSYTSTSNTITSDISRIKGLTINLKGLTEGSAVTLTVERDKETLANAISDVVDSYNELMKNVDESIAVGGDLHDETTLKLIRNQLRSIMTSSDIGTTIFKNLDSIGISVDSASANNISTSNESIISLTFDKDKFIQAYEADQDAVKDLLIGGDTNTGIFTKAEQLVESALQSVTGYFDSADRSFDREISRLDDKITKANQEVERYRERLEAKFAAMDLLIAQMQQQYSTFLTT